MLPTRQHSGAPVADVQTHVRQLAVERGLPAPQLPETPAPREQPAVEAPVAHPPDLLGTLAAAATPPPRATPEITAMEELTFGGLHRLLGHLQATGGLYEERFASLLAGQEALDNKLRQLENNDLSEKLEGIQRTMVTSLERCHTEQAVTSLRVDGIADRLESSVHSLEAFNQEASAKLVEIESKIENKVGSQLNKARERLPSSLGPLEHSSAESTSGSADRDARATASHSERGFPTCCVRAAARRAVGPHAEGHRCLAHSARGADRRARGAAGASGAARVV